MYQLSRGQRLNYGEICSAEYFDVLVWLYPTGYMAILMTNTLRNTGC